MHNYSGPVELQFIKQGQRVKIVCAKINTIFRTNCGCIEGTVSEVFNGMDPIGYQIDVRNTTQWWRWIPSLDGGEIYLIKE
jgi:hypothetical protein